VPTEIHVPVSETTARPRNWKFCWLLALALLAGTAPAENKPAPPQHPESAGPPAPKPAPAHRERWAAAFHRPVPTSIPDLRAMQDQVRNLVKRLSPAVVEVEVGYGSGSGVVISTDGLVLSAGHVCSRAGRDVRVTFADGKRARGKTLGADADSDTGLIRITDSGPWPCAAMGDLAKTGIGDWVLALGHPGGFDAKRSLVVRLGRIIRLTSDAVQTDCTISPGDSGGPLFDMSGRVIGIHSAISSSLSENLHVPVTEFYTHWDQLLSPKTKPEEKSEAKSETGE